MSTAREALTRDLRHLRETSRGDVRKFRLKYRHEGENCALKVVVIYAEEARGGAVYQAPSYCNRCRNELTDYVGYERGW